MASRYKLFSMAHHSKKLRQSMLSVPMFRRKNITNFSNEKFYFFPITVFDSKISVLSESSRVANSLMEKIAPKHMKWNGKWISKVCLRWRQKSTKCKGSYEPGEEGSRQATNICYRHEGTVTTFLTNKCCNPLIGSYIFVYERRKAV